MFRMKGNLDRKLFGGILLLIPVFLTSAGSSEQGAKKTDPTGKHLTRLSAVEARAVIVCGNSFREYLTRNKGFGKWEDHVVEVEPEGNFVAVHFFPANLWRPGDGPFRKSIGTNLKYFYDPKKDDFDKVEYE